MGPPLPAFAHVVHSHISIIAKQIPENGVGVDYFLPAGIGREKKSPSGEKVPTDQDVDVRIRIGHISRRVRIYYQTWKNFGLSRTT